MTLPLTGPAKVRSHSWLNPFMNYIDRVVTAVNDSPAGIKSVSFVWDPTVDPWSVVMAQPSYVKQIYVLGTTGTVPPGRWELPGVTFWGGEPNVELKIPFDAVLHGIAGFDSGLRLNIDDNFPPVYALWEADHDFAVGDLRASLPINGTHPGVYRCTVAGRSAAVGNGPYNVGASDIVDGTAHWEFWGGGGNLDWAFNFPDHIGPVGITVSDGAGISLTQHKSAIIVPDGGIFIFQTPNSVGFQGSEVDSLLASLGDSAILVWLPTGWDGGDTYQFDHACDGPATSLFGILHNGIPGPYGVPPAPAFLGTMGNSPLGLDGGSGPTSQRPQSFMQPLDGVVYWDTDIGKKIVNDGSQWNAITTTGPV